MITMAKNYMADVAKMLGVELDEEFKLENHNENYKLTENGLMYSYGTHRAWYDLALKLCYILNGKYAIKKLPWKPKSGEDYFYVYWCYRPNEGWVLRVGKAKEFATTSRTDNLYKDTGNCFRTNKEAEAAKYEVFKRLTGMDWARTLRHEGGDDNAVD